MARAGVGWALALAAAGAWAQQSASPQGIYTCVDAQGRRITADRPIAACIDREQRVLGPMGTERQRIGPTLTEKEREAQEAQRRKSDEERARLNEERRRERALLNRYPDQATHDAERAAVLAQLDQITGLAQKRIAELREQRKKLDTEMEFFSRTPKRRRWRCAARSRKTKMPLRSSSASSRARKKKSAR